MKLDLKALIDKLLGDHIYLYTKSLTVTAAVGKASWVVPLSLPAGAQILSITIMRLPNPNWVYADIYIYSNTSVTIAYNNIYSGNITDPLELAVLYRK